MYLNNRQLYIIGYLMPNKKGGKKFKRGKKTSISTSLVYKDDKEDQEYARVEQVYGSGRYKLFCFDGIERLGISAGNIKRVRIYLKDIVLISKWDFQDTKCSIIFKYDDEQVHQLNSANQFPDNLHLDNFEECTDNDDIFDYNITEEQNIDNEDRDNADSDNEDSDNEDSDNEDSKNIDLNDI